MPKKLQFKVIVAGPTKTGKSTLIQQLIRGEPISEAEVIAGLPGVGRTDIVEKIFKVRGHEVTLNVWDAIGQTDSLSTLFYRESVGIILVYDCTDAQSLEELSKYERKSEDVIKNFESVIFFLAANKSDSDRRDEETISDGREKAEGKGYEFFVVSAQNGDGVFELFQKMAESLLQKYLEDPNTFSSKGGNVELAEQSPNQSTSKRDGCCN